MTVAVLLLLINRNQCALLCCVVFYSLIHRIPAMYQKTFLRDVIHSSSKTGVLLQISFIMPTIRYDVPPSALNIYFIVL